MMQSEQLQFPFPSLDFPGRTMLYAHEIAERIGISVDQVYDLNDDNSLPGLPIGRKETKSNRRSLRFPIESYRAFIVGRMTGPLQIQLLQKLPKAAIRDLIRELQEYLRKN